MLLFQKFLSPQSVFSWGWLVFGAISLLGCESQNAPVVIIVTPAESNLDETPLGSESELIPTPTLNPAIAGDTLGGATGQDALTVATTVPAETETPLPTPTATPNLPPSELLTNGLRQLELENMGSAASFFQRILDNPESSPELLEIAKLNLGIALVDEGDIEQAKELWVDYAQSATDIDASVWYRLAVIESEPATAEQHYLTFLESHPELGPYIYPKLAQLNPEKEEEYLQFALNSGAWYRQTIDVRRELATLYSEQEAYGAAIAQFQAIRDAAFTPFTKGEMTYKIGETYALAGDSQAAIETWQFGLTQFPTANGSYLGLAELVELDVPVDNFQRGLVDYHAGVYGPGIEAFQAYLVENPENYRADVHLFLAWSYEQTKQFEAAREQLDLYLATNPEDGLIIGTYYKEREGIETRSIATSQGVDTLTEFIENYPNHAEMAWVRWRRAVLADRFMLQPDLAIPFYEEFVDFHPADENASAALLRLGLLHDGSGNFSAAIDAWTRAAQFEDDNARAALLWLVISDVEPDPTWPSVATVSDQTTNYYGLRVNALLNNQTDRPFASSELNLAIDPETEKAEAEAWLAQQLGVAQVSSALPESIASDGRLIRGRNLWRIGDKDAAKWELESLREDYAQDAVASYQLALEFQKIGLYRSSILAGFNVLVQTGSSIYDAPIGVARLVYPTYYDDMIFPLADEYGYDPLLHFSLIRQESLFEGFATSSAYAQGLSQIIPDTGEFVAQRLKWTDYENADLYKPHISLTFGAYYFDQQLDLFDGFYPAALAAYNGGPGNAIRWYEEAGADPDLYLETINFSETRLYLRTIYSNYQVYRTLYGPQEQ